MNHLLLNVLLAVIWAAVSGAFTLVNLLLGFVLGFVVLRYMRPLLGSDGARYNVRALHHQIGLVGFFFRELLLSSVRVAAEVVTPGYNMKTGIIAVPLDVKNDVGITMLANLISLTPGTLSLDVSEDRKTLFIHAMYIHPDDLERSRAEIKESMERRVVRALSAPGGE